MHVIQVTHCDTEVLTALNNLLPQLSSNAQSSTENFALSIINSENTHLLFAIENAMPVGMLTLVIIRTMTGTRALIEDVVVDKQYRGQGVGQALNIKAIELAQEFGARNVNLTSHPSREAANRLYQRIGFTRRETNTYRYSFSE